MDQETSHTFAEASQRALTDAATSLEQSTKGSNGSDDAHKRAFLETFRRWEILFKRKDGDVASAKWLIAEYYASLGHLSEAGFRALTDRLKETCVFFPTIKECLDVTRCDQYDWGNPFRGLGSGGSHVMLRSAPPARRLAAPVEQIEHDA